MTDNSTTKAPIITRATSDLRLQQSVAVVVVVIAVDDGGGRVLLPMLSGFDIPPPPRPLPSWRWRSGNADDDFAMAVVRDDT